MLRCKTIASRFLERGLRLNKFTIRIRTKLITPHIRSREKNSQIRKRSRHTQPWWRSSLTLLLTSPRFKMSRKTSSTLAAPLEGVVLLFPPVSVSYVFHLMCVCSCFFVVFSFLRLFFSSHDFFCARGNMNLSFCTSRWKDFWGKVVLILLGVHLASNGFNRPCAGLASCGHPEAV